MNSKKAKTLRRMLRANGVDPRQAELTGADGYITRGLTGPIAIVAQRRLVPSCGRAAYKAAKRMAA